MGRIFRQCSSGAQEEARQNLLSQTMYAGIPFSAYFEENYYAATRFLRSLCGSFYCSCWPVNDRLACLWAAADDGKIGRAASRERSHHRRKNRGIETGPEGGREIWAAISPGGAISRWPLAHGIRNPRQSGRLLFRSDRGRSMEVDRWGQYLEASS